MSEVSKLEGMLRQNLFKRTFKEVPYESYIELKSWVPLSNGELSLVFKIEVKNQNHRAIVLGRDSLNIKEIIANTRKDISEMIQRPCKVGVIVSISKIQSVHKSNDRQAINI